MNNSRSKRIVYKCIEEKVYKEVGTKKQYFLLRYTVELLVNFALLISFNLTAIC